MRCETALDRMMEAAPAELTPGGDTQLARHLASCDRCGRVAATLRQELEAIDAAMRSFADAGDARAAAEAAVGSRAGTAPGPRRPERQAGPRRRWIRTRWLPLAAAATLAAILLVGRGEEPVGDRATRDVATAPPAVEVEPPADRRVAILKTADPKITIVWLYHREGT